MSAHFVTPDSPDDGWDELEALPRPTRRPWKRRPLFGWWPIPWDLAAGREGQPNTTTPPERRGQPSGDGQPSAAHTQAAPGAEAECRTPEAAEYSGGQVNPAPDLWRADADKSLDPTAFNTAAEARALALMPDLVGKSLSYVVGYLAYELDISPATAKRYLQKYSIHPRAPYQQLGGKLVRREVP